MSAPSSRAATPSSASNRSASSCRSTASITSALCPTRCSASARSRPASRSAPRAPAAARELVAFLESPAWAPSSRSYGLEQIGFDADDWRTLFNGRDLDRVDAEDSQATRSAKTIADTFRVRDGVLTVAYDGYETFDERFGHLFFARAVLALPTAHRIPLRRRASAERAGLGRAQQRRDGALATAADDAARSRLSDLDRGAVLGRAKATASRGRQGNVCSPGTRIVYDGQPDTAHCIQSAAPTIDGDDVGHGRRARDGSERIVHYIDGSPVIEYGGVSYGGGNVTGHDPAKQTRRRSRSAAATSRCRARAIRSSSGASSCSNLEGREACMMHAMPRDEPRMAGGASSLLGMADAAAAEPARYELDPSTHDDRVPRRAHRLCEDSRPVPDARAAATRSTRRPARCPRCASSVETESVDTHHEARDQPLAQPRLPRQRQRTRR